MGPRLTVPLGALLLLTSGLVAQEHKEGIPQEPQYFFVTSNLGMAGVPEDLQREAFYVNIPLPGRPARPARDPLRGEKLQLQLNVLNLFNQRATINRLDWELEPGATVSMTPEEFFRGVDTEALIQEQGLLKNPGFLMDSEFQAPREIRLGIRFAF